MLPLMHQPPRQHTCNDNGISASISMLITYKQLRRTRVKQSKKEKDIHTTVK